MVRNVRKRDREAGGSTSERSEWRTKMFGEWRRVEPDEPERKKSAPSIIPDFMPLSEEVNPTRSTSLDQYGYTGDQVPQAVRIMHLGERYHTTYDSAAPIMKTFPKRSAVPKKRQIRMDDDDFTRADELARAQMKEGFMIKTPDASPTRNGSARRTVSPATVSRSPSGSTVSTSLLGSTVSPISFGSTGTRSPYVPTARRQSTTSNERAIIQTPSAPQDSHLSEKERRERSDAEYFLDVVPSSSTKPKSAPIFYSDRLPQSPNMASGPTSGTPSVASGPSSPGDTTNEWSEAKEREYFRIDTTVTSHRVQTTGGTPSMQPRSKSCREESATETYSNLQCDNGLFSATAKEYGAQALGVAPGHYLRGGKTPWWNGRRTEEYDWSTKEERW